MIYLNIFFLFEIYINKLALCLTPLLLFFSFVQLVLILSFHVRLFLWFASVFHILLTNFQSLIDEKLLLVDDKMRVCKYAAIVE